MINNYDLHENLIEVIFNNSEGELKSRFEYLYDPHSGLLNTVISFDKFNNEKAIRKKYFKGEKILKEETFLPSGELEFWSDYNYNEQGNQINYKSVSNSGKERVYRNEYKYHKDFYERYSYGSSNILETFVKFDSHGNEIEKIFYNKNGDIRMEMISEVDEHGNWVKENFKASGKLSIGVREISYYQSLEFNHK